MITPSQISSYYGHYYKIRSTYSRGILEDVYGLLAAELKPRDVNHPYYKFIKLESDFEWLLLELKHDWITGIPHVKALLETELGFDNSINPLFFHYLALGKEE